ncbi:MAG: hypothetical protein ACYTHJ_22795, partial [Planctomycetota bacterium]
MRWNRTAQLIGRNTGTMPGRLASLALLAGLVTSLSGCLAAAGVGVKLVGSAVDDADIKEREAQLMRAPVARADEMFGKSLDTYSDINSNRAWRVYN